MQSFEVTEVLSSWNVSIIGLYETPLLLYSCIPFYLHTLPPFLSPEASILTV